MRTILYSTERVTANNWETGLFIVFLLIFAIAASAYVLINGLKVTWDRSDHGFEAHGQNCTNETLRGIHAII